MLLDIIYLQRRRDNEERKARCHYSLVLDMVRIILWNSLCSGVGDMVDKIELDEFTKALGVVLRTLRKVRGRKVITVYGATGLSETSISNWERGIQMPSLPKLMKLAEFYNVQLSTIILNAEKTVYLTRKGNQNDRDE